MRLQLLQQSNFRGKEQLSAFGVCNMDFSEGTSLLHVHLVLQQQILIFSSQPLLLPLFGSKRGWLPLFFRLILNRQSRACLWIPRIVEPAPAAEKKSYTGRASAAGQLRPARGEPGLLPADHRRGPGCASLMRLNTFLERVANKDTNES